MLVCWVLSKRTLNRRDPSSLILILFPTISAGYTRSSRMELWTAVRVLDLGLFCFSLLAFLVGLGRILLWAINTTCLPLNFFSSSLTSLAWIFWKAFSCGTGTKMTIAFLFPGQSTSLTAVI